MRDAAAVDLLAPLVDLFHGEGTCVHLDQGQRVAVGDELVRVVCARILQVPPAFGAPSCAGRCAHAHAGRHRH